MNREKDSGESPHPDEGELIRKFQRSSSMEAFDLLVLKYQDMVFNVCFRITGDYDDASDCAQETFIRVYRHLASFEFRSAFSTWLYRIAVNTCRNRLASASARMGKKTISLDRKNSPEEGGAGLGIANGRSDPERLYEKGELDRAIQAALDKLPAELRILAVLRDIEGKSYEEIAAVTGLRQGTVKSRISRARRSLRQELRGII